MTRQWIRNCVLKTDDGFMLNCGEGNGGDPGLRVRFQTVSHTQQTLGQASIVVTNASQQTAAKFQKEYTKVSLLTGWRDEEYPPKGVLFSGSVTHSEYGFKEGNTDVLLKLWLLDGDLGYNSGKVSTTLAAGATPQNIVDECLKTLKPYGISMGTVAGIDLSTPRLPKSCSLYGMTRDVLRGVALSKGASWNLNFGKLNMVGKGAMVPGGATKLGPTTGLIGQAIQTEQGIIARCLINPAITVDSNIALNPNSIVKPVIQNTSVSSDTGNLAANLQDQGVNDSVYRVLKVTTEGDSRGNAWDMELICIGAFSGSVNKVQSGMWLV